MFGRHSIRALYPLALVEGEGVGTAYEYAAKRQVLRRWWRRTNIQKPPAGALLIAGLPEIYGSSLDYFLLAQELDRQVLVVDEDMALLDKARDALVTAQKAGLLANVHPHFLPVQDLTQLLEIRQPVSWAICNEVLQRFDPAGRLRYAESLAALAPMITLFAPNGGNEAHLTSSGLASLPPAEMAHLLDRLPGRQITSGFCDLPPFPPGITRSTEQRAQAETGRVEAAAMWGLDWFVRLEPWLPAGWQEQRAHIVYGFAYPT